MPPSSNARVGFHQLVRPAGAGREAGWVLLAAALILSTAVLAAKINQVPQLGASVAAHELDSRTGLTAAEQGLFADLRAAVPEVVALGSPDPDALMTEGLAPFVPDASWRNRGSLTWSLQRVGGQVAYLGLSADPSVAGSFLLVMDPHGPEIWLRREAKAPESLDPSALASSGWRRVVSTFTAGVTR